MTIETAGSGSTRAVVLSAVLIALVGLGLYWRALDAPFVYDDVFSIVEDESIRSFSTALDPRPGSNADGRPLVSLTLALNHALGGLDVFGYRLFNIAVHVAAAIALFGVLRRTLASTGTALACALLWVAHPLNTDALNMVVTRNESLCALFYLVALWACARGFQSQRRGVWFGTAIIAAFLAAASKETAVTLPVAVLLYDRAFVSKSIGTGLRRHAGLYSGLLAMVLFLIVLTLGAERGASVGFDMGVPWGRYVVAQVEIAVQYLRLAFWPDPLVVDYGDWSVWRGDRAPWLAGLVLVTLALATLLGFVKRNGSDLLGWLFFGVLAPTSLIPVSNEIAGEHRMYLPLIAVIVAVVLAARRLLRDTPRFTPMCAVCVVGIALGARTVDRNRDYNDPVRLWGAALEEYPQNTRAAVFLGDELFRAQLPESAYRVYCDGLEVNPTHSMLLARAAQALRTLGREGEARALDRRRELGGSGPRFDALAAANEQLVAGDARAAVTALRAALARWPEFARARRRLARVLATTGDPDLRNGSEALQIAEDLCAGMSPPDPTHLDLLGIAQAACGRFEEAADTVRRAHALALAYGQPELARTIVGRLAGYESGRPLISSDY